MNNLARSLALEVLGISAFDNHQCDLDEKPDDVVIELLFGHQTSVRGYHTPQERVVVSEVDKVHYWAFLKWMQQHKVRGLEFIIYGDDFTHQCFIDDPARLTYWNIDLQVECKLGDFSAAATTNLFSSRVYGVAADV